MQRAAFVQIQTDEDEQGQMRLRRASIYGTIWQTRRIENGFPFFLLSSSLLKYLNFIIVF